MKTIVIIALGLILLLVWNNFTRVTVKLATTTSTYETGILDYLLRPFQKRHNITVDIISTGTGKAIKLGENGDVDAILVHAKEAEDRFVSEGYGVNRQELMYNDFVILGPGSDPAEITGLKDITEVLRRIHRGKYTFVSRGDDSGTDQKEKYLWTKARLSPQGAWYLETGQGMSATLRMADEKNAYIIVDRATYLFNKDKIRLKKLVEENPDLFNSYSVIAVNPAKYPQVKYELSMRLIEWLMSPECRQMINNYKIKGKQLFHANRKSNELYN